jgi:hypothetical protein
MDARHGLLGRGVFRMGGAMAGKGAPAIYDEQGRRLCRLCRVNIVPPGNLRNRRYVCSKCYRRSPVAVRYEASDKARATKARYKASDKRRAAQGRSNAKRNPRRIWVAGRYHSMARTPEQAEMLNDHVRRRIDEFKQEQSARAQFVAGDPWSDLLRDTPPSGQPVGQPSRPTVGVSPIAHRACQA